jgi:hypothetical protein
MCFEKRTCEEVGLKKVNKEEESERSSTGQQASEMGGGERAAAARSCTAVISARLTAFRCGCRGGVDLIFSRLHNNTTV